MTNSNCPPICQATLVDSIQLKGWTPQTLQRAASELSRLGDLHANELADDGAQLAIELTRWLRYAARDDPASLVAYLDARWPMGEDESHWDRLGTLLAKDEPLDVAIHSLQRCYHDPVPVLCTLLHAQLEPSELFGDLDPWHQRAVECLLVLATCESIVFLLSRVSLPLWVPSDAFKGLVKRRADAFVEAATAAWPRLDWENREKLIEIHDQCQLDTGPLLALLFATDTNSLGYESLCDCVDTVVNIGAMDPQTEASCEELLHRVIARALDDIERHQTHDDAAECAGLAGQALEERGLALAPDLHARAQELGLRLGQRLGSSHQS
jgi:hypothetical protein